MPIDGAVIDAKRPSPPSAVAANRTVIAASGFGAVGTQVAGSAGRSRGNGSS